LPLLLLLSDPPPSLAGVAPDVGEWKQVGGLECTDSDRGSINGNGDPVVKEGEYSATFHSPDTTPALLGTGPGQCEYHKATYGGGNVRVGVRGGVDGGDAAYVILQDGTVSLNSAISHNGKYHRNLSPATTKDSHDGEYHDEAIFKPRPGQTVYFRVSRVGVGQFTAEMMVEGGPWGHLTPNGEPLLPKTEEGVRVYEGVLLPMEGMRVYVYLHCGATVSDLRVGNQRKKPMKSANKRLQFADAEGEKAAVPRH
jgi:hypothetical protein